MSVDRRFILRGMALGSLASLTLGGSLPALAGLASTRSPRGDRSVLALGGTTTAGSAFVHGARAALGEALQVRQLSPELHDLLDVERQLRSDESLEIIGLLDDASAVLLVDLARTAGARLHWLGQHSAEAGLSHHRLLTTGLTEGCTRQLDRQLHACGAGFTLSEARQGSAAGAAQLAGTSRHGEHTDQWAAIIGYLLGAPGVHRPAVAPLLPPGSPASIGSFVSFLLKT